MVKQQHQTGHPRIVANVSGLSKPPVDWVTNGFVPPPNSAPDRSAGASTQELVAQAEQASQKANDASKQANRGMDGDGHQNAAEAHADAKEANLKAAARFGAEGNTTQARFHQQVAQSHDEKSDQHSQMADNCPAKA